jgi:hypothetical protein
VDRLGRFLEMWCGRQSGENDSPGNTVGRLLRFNRRAATGTFDVLVAVAQRDAGKVKCCCREMDGAGVSEGSLTEAWSRPAEAVFQTAAIGQKTLDPAQEGRADGLRVGQAAGVHGTVSEHDEVPRCGLWVDLSGGGEEFDHGC